MQRHVALVPPGQVWIDAQPRPAPDQATPVKTLTVFKTCTDDEDDEPRRADSVVPESGRSGRPPATPGKHSRRRADPGQDAHVPAKQAQEKPACGLPLAGLTLDQLYTQCEQLAESLDRDERDAEGAAGYCSSDDASDDLSAALDVASEQVSVGCDSWRRVRHSQVISEESEPADAGLGRHPGVPVLNKACDYSPEYIEVEEPDEPVPTQDSCLQVTEEDIALSMMQALEAKIDCDVRSVSSGGDHPLRALSHDNLTVISHFTGETYSQGTASEWEPIGPSVLDSVTLASCSPENANFYQAQLEQLAKLHQQLYEQSVAGGASALPAPSLGALAAHCPIGSFKVIKQSNPA